MRNQVESIIPDPKHQKMVVLKNRSPELYDRLMKETDYLPEDYNLRQRLLFIDNGGLGSCKTCGKDHANITSDKRSVSPYCSKTCMFSDSSYTKGRVSGVDQSKRVEKMVETNQRKYGVSYQSQRSEVKKILKKSKVSDNNVLKKLQDKDWLTEQYKTKPSTQIADDLDIYYGTVIDYLKSHGVDINGHTNKSYGENELKDYIESLGFDVIQSDRSILPNGEIDLFVPEKNLAIEYCGLYWHSAKFKSPKYHQSKALECAKKGVKLLTVFDVDDSDLVKSTIRSHLGLNNKIYARQCEFRCVDNASYKGFVDDNHHMGSAPAKYKLGLFHSGLLVMVASFSKSRFERDVIECIRMCTLRGHTVVGGVSKLFKAMRNIEPESKIVTYADIRYGMGECYKHAGMEMAGVTKPNYWYISKQYKLYSRMKFQKHKLAHILENFDPNLTEFENMRNHGWNWIYDCGSVKYVSA